MENEQAYKEIIEKILESKIKLFGYFAVRVAKGTPGLELDDYGKVISISGSRKEIIRYILLKFEDKSGEVSTIALRSLLVELKSKYSGIDLPEELM